MSRLVPCNLAVLLLAIVPAVLAQNNPAPINAPIRVSSGVMEGLIVTKAAPVYPPEAKAAHVQGIVVLHAVIGKDGRVQNITVVNGPEELRDSALEAVRQWTYKPYLLNGNPVDVVTQITVNYVMSQPAPAGVPGGVVAPPSTPESSPSGRVRVSAAVMNGLITTQKPPVYPKVAKAAHITGAVVLAGVIDKQGKVTELNVLSGPELLRQAAVDAVSQWTFNPYLLNGQPVDVITSITVNFTLTN